MGMIKVVRTQFAYIKIRIHGHGWPESSSSPCQNNSSFCVLQTQLFSSTVRSVRQGNQPKEDTRLGRSIGGTACIVEMELLLMQWIIRIIIK